MKKKGLRGLNTGASIQSFRIQSAKRQARTVQLLSVQYLWGRNTTRESLKEHHQNLIPDGGITSNSCGYSLNKHRRWEIMTVLSEAIDEVPIEDGIQITCREQEIPLDYPTSKPRQRWYERLFQSDCIGYHDNNLERRHVIPKRHANPHTLRSIEKTIKDKRKLRKQRRQINARLTAHFRGGRSNQRQVNFNKMISHQDHSEPEPNRDWGNISELRFDVVHPLPFSSHRCFHSSHEERLCKTNRTHYRQRLKDVLRRQNEKKKIFELENDLYIDDVDEDMLQTAIENSLQDELDSDQNPAPQSSFSLCDAVVFKEPQRKGKKRRKTASCSELSPKPHKLIYEERQQTETVPFNQDLSYDNAIELIIDDPNTLDIKVLSESVQSELMQSRYGEDFVESKTVPRMFSVNIAPNLTLIGREKETDWEMVEGQQCYTELSIRFTDDSEAYFARITCGIQQLENEIPDFGQVVEFATDETRSCENSSTVLKSDALTKLWMPCDELRIHSASAADSLISKEHFRTLSQKTCSSIKPNNEHVCGVCYSEDDLTCLECGHWFCNECWAIYLANRVKMSDVHIRCPSSKCDVCVDITTLQWFLRVEDFRELVSNIKNHVFEHNPCWRKCPRCSRCVEVPGSLPSTLNIECPCGFHWCFFCAQSFHWPATCSQAKHYRTALEKLGLLGKDNGLINHVRVKMCPNCKYPIQKNGGCPHMYCTLCRTSFCWKCLRRFNESSYNHYNDCGQSSTEEIHVMLFSFTMQDVRGLWYERALEFRKETTKRCALLITELAFKNRNTDFTGLKAFVGDKEFKNSEDKFLSYYGCSVVANTMRQIATFQRMLAVIMEFSCVLAGTTRRKNSVRKAEKALVGLKHVRDSLNEILTGRAPEDIVRRLTTLLAWSSSELQELDIITRRLHNV